MGDNAEEPAKNWQIDALDKRLLSQERFNERIEKKLDQIIVNQATPKQLEEMRTSLNNSFDMRLGALRAEHDADIREINLKYAPTTKSFNKLQATIIGAVLLQALYILFNNIGK